MGIQQIDRPGFIAEEQPQLSQTKEVEIAVLHIHGNGHQLGRHQEREDHQAKEHALEAEIEPGKAVADHRADEHMDDRGMTVICAVSPSTLG